MSFNVAKVLLTATLGLAACYPVQAGTLQVEPVLVDVTAPGAASTVTLRNEGAAQINAQIRVFRWSLVDGQEKLEPTDDVVASPPSVTLTPKGQYIARIVRVSKQPVVGEESYRLLVDQLPDLSQQKNGAVNLLMRYSIPVFFGASNKKNPTVDWSLAVRGDKVTLTAHNSGDRRLRISALSVRDANGKSISFGTGLAGYALGQSTKTWTVPGHGIAAKGPATISGQSDGGPIQAVATVASR
ncbi:MAG TPA: molecular chaperone [Xanthobacteraceae bacterium]